MLNAIVTDENRGGMNMKFRHSLLAVLLPALLLSGCAANRHVNEAEIFERHAGESVNDIRLTQLRNWRPLNQDTLLLGARRDAYYLVDLAPPCGGSLRSARRLAIPGRTRVGQLTLFDDLLVDGYRCRIMRMRRVDHAAAQEEIERESEK